MPGRKSRFSTGKERGNTTMKKIILLCAAGMSTSILVKKMKEAAGSSHLKSRGKFNLRA